MNRTAEIRALQALIAVAREGSISRAAELLNLTQPAVSLQLKRLSEDTGLVLFKRMSKGMVLTRDGSVLLAKAEKVVSALTEFGLTARRIKGQVRGTVRIGTIIDPEFIRLGQLLAGLVSSHSDLRAELEHGISGNILKLILAKKIDMGFYLGDPVIDPNKNIPIQGDNKDELFVRHLADFKYVVIAPAGWETQVLGKDWPALCELPWIGTPSESVHHRLLAQVESKFDCKLNKVALVDQEQSMLAMVRSGVGLSLCRESIALNERQARGLAIADQVAIPASLNFVTHAIRLQDPLVSAVFDVLDDIWKH